MAKVTLKQVEKSFGDNRVVCGVDLEVADGEFLVLVGPSGCGKSTLLRMLAGLEQPTGGEILIGDRVVNTLRPRDRDVAMVFQSYALYPHMTVRENLGFGLKVRKTPPGEVSRAVDEAAKLLDISHLLDRKPKEMSGGQRQRVAMGRALVRRPQVFLFDEPLSNLDAALRSRMRVELKRLHNELKVTTVYVTHDQIEAMTLADRIALMHKGVMQQVGRPQDLYNWPANKYTASFLGSPGMNFVEAEIDGVDISAEGLTLKVNRKLLGDAEPQGPVLVGVRPHDVLRSAGYDRRDDDTGRIDATVAALEPMGWETHVHLDVAGQSWIARFDAAQAADLAIGDKMVLQVEPRAIRLFDRDTEEALCTAP